MGSVLDFLPIFAASLSQGWKCQMSRTDPIVLKRRGLTPLSAPRRARPMAWVFAEYGGQAALQQGPLKLVRRNLLAKGGPGPWELYDIEADPGEERDLAASRPEEVRRLATVLRGETAENRVFPVPLGK